MLTGAVLVWFGAVIGLRLLSGGGAWLMSWGVAIGVGTALWPAMAMGYVGLSRLFGSDEKRDDELLDSALTMSLVGVPGMAISFLWSGLVIGAIRLLQSFKDPPSGGVVNFVMSLLALHVITWAGAGLVQWGWSLVRGRQA